MPIYLDYAATTPVDPAVAACLAACLTHDGLFGNPASATHGFGRAAAAAVEQARAQVAALLGAHADEIIWTSGATEANNLALCGALRGTRKGRHLITAQSEHKAVLDVCRHLEREGCTVTWLTPDRDGLIDPQQVAAALRPNTALVSLMHVNNETGVIQDLATIAALTQARGILLHVDAAQSVGKLPIDLSTLPIDLLSVSAHKLYGPKGIGALYVRRRPRPVRLDALLHGGGQERGLRPGTLPVHQIVAFAEACRIAGERMATEPARIAALRERLWRALQPLGAVERNGHPEHCVAGILNLSFHGISAEALLAALPDIALSTGSACTSTSTALSHVLRAMGRDAFAARAAVRFSLGRFTTPEDIDTTISAVRIAVTRLRNLSPLWTDTGRLLPADTVDWAAVP